jgi:hypothetical protein
LTGLRAEDKEQQRAQKKYSAHSCGSEKTANTIRHSPDRLKTADMQMVSKLKTNRKKAPHDGAF